MRLFNKTDFSAAKLILAILLMFSLEVAWSQGAFQKVIGTELNEYGVGIILIENGNLLILYHVDDSDDDFAIVMTDHNGNLISTKRYYLPGNQDPVTFQKSNDGGYFVAGNDLSTGNSRNFIVKLNENLEIEWSKTISYVNAMSFFMIREDFMGNIYMGSDCKNNNLNDFILVKLNGQGGIIWQRSMGIAQNDHIYDIHFSSDGSLYCFGSTWYSGAELTLFTINPDGEIKSQKSIFQGPNFYPRKIVELENGEFIVLGNDQLSLKSFIIKMDNNLQAVWSKFIGGTDLGNTISVYLNSGCVVDNVIYLTGNSNADGGDIIVVSMNPDGSVNWMKSYGSMLSESIEVLARTSIFGHAGTLFLCGSSTGFGSGNSDCYIIKTGIDGISGCNEHEISHFEEIIYPNPYNIDITANFSISVNGLNITPQTTENPVVITLCPEALQANFSVSNQYICQDERISFTDLSLNFPISWYWQFEGASPASSIMQNPVDIYYENPGSFNVTLIISNGIESDTLTRENYIQVAPKPMIELGEDQCIEPGGFIAIDAGTGFESYLWSNGLENNWIIADEPGIYWVEVTNTFGCSGSDTIEIFTGYNPNFNLGDDQTLCEGTTTLLDAGPGYSSYLWSTGSSNQSITISEPGQYWVMVTNESGCHGYDTINITQGVINVDLGDDKAICSGGSIMLEIPDNFSQVLWSTGSSNQSITISEPGQYWVMVTDDSGCHGYDTINITQGVINVDLGDDKAICSGGSIMLEIPDNFSQVLWSTGETSHHAVIHDEGTYWIRVNDSLNCVATDTVNIVFYPGPLIQQITFLSQGKIEVLASGGLPPYEYSIDSNLFQGSNEFVNVLSGFHSIILKDANGCTHDTIVFIPEIILDIPNFFTPNGDHVHDTWEIEGIFQYPDAVIQIFDRFGKLLVTYKATNGGWNGKYNDLPVPSDTYWYQISFSNGDPPVSGDVSIIR